MGSTAQRRIRRMSEKQEKKFRAMIEKETLEKIKNTPKHILDKEIEEFQRIMEEDANRNRTY